MAINATKYVRTSQLFTSTNKSTYEFLAAVAVDVVAQAKTDAEVVVAVVAAAALVLADVSNARVVVAVPHKSHQINTHRNKKTEHPHLLLDEEALLGRERLLQLLLFQHLQLALLLDVIQRARFAHLEKHCTMNCVVNEPNNQSIGPA
jgi:hypothetical protein